MVGPLPYFCLGRECKQSSNERSWASTKTESSRVRVAPFWQEFHASPSLHAPCNLVPRSLVDEVDKRTGYEITRLAKGGIFRKKTQDCAVAYCPSVYFVCIYLVIRSYWEWRHFKLLRQPRGAFWVRVSDVLTIPACTWEKNHNHLGSVTKQVYSEPHSFKS